MSVFDALILRGFISDFFLMSLLACIFLFKYTTFKKLFPLITLLLILLSAANLEHILAMNTSVSFSAFKFALQGAALKGALNSSLISTVFLITGCVACFFVSRSIKKSDYLVFSQKPFKQKIFLFITPAVLMVLLLIVPVQFNSSQWKQSNVLIENTVHLFNLSLNKNNKALKTEESKALVRALEASDLSGERIYQGSKKNILLIMLEGISGHHVFHPNDNSIWSDGVFMPRLAERSHQAIQYTHFLAPQVQTNRGEYALLCGDHPNLASPAAKMSITKPIFEAKPYSCLPKILKDQGYQTSYLQAAGMEFMSKDTFMPEAGFEYSSGQKWFKKPYLKHSWGISDGDFFKQSFREIERLEENSKPWFLAMLTVGTHHSYQIPEEFVDKNLSPYANAVAYADKIVVEFLDELEDRNILDDTLVVITADESQGSNLDESLITKNWIPFIVFDSGIVFEAGEQGKKIDHTFRQTDFSISMIDYLGLDKNLESLPPGRSFFRNNTSPRDFYFSQSYNHTAYWMNKDNVLLKCDVSYSKCERYIYPNEYFFWAPNQYEKTSLDSKSVQVARYVSEQNDWDFERFYTQGESDEHYSPWHGEFFTDDYLKGKSLKVNHRVIDFNWSKEPPFQGFTRYAFSARWQSCLKLDKKSTLSIELVADEGSRLSVNGSRLIDAWTGKAGKEQSASIELDPGIHNIGLDYRARYWHSHIKLSLYLKSDGENVLIEPEQLSQLNVETGKCE